MAGMSIESHRFKATFGTTRRRVRTAMRKLTRGRCMCTKDNFMDDAGNGVVILHE
jgi:hypothetical protein